MQAFEELYLMARRAKCQKAEQYFLKKMIMGILMNETGDKLKNYIYDLYHHADSLVSFAIYFQVKGSLLIAITLYQFEQSQDLPNFYAFLATLAKFVTKFPFTENFLHWNHNIERLMRQERYRTLMKYDVLSN
jgi:hypothetical protein